MVKADDYEFVEVGEVRTVEVEQAPCHHMHSWNYDPDDAKRGFPLKELPNNQMKCMDCGEFFTPRLPKPAKPKYTLDELEQLAREWCDESHTSVQDRLVVSTMISWARKREREVGDAGCGMRMKCK